MRIVLFQGWSDNGSSWLMIFVVMRMVYDVVGGGVDDGGVFVGLWSRNSAASKDRKCFGFFTEKRQFGI